MAARKRYMRDMRRVAREAKESKLNGRENGPILVDYKLDMPQGTVNGVVTVSPIEEREPCGKSPTDL